MRQTNAFERLHEQQRLGTEFLAGADTLLGLLDTRLQQYLAFTPSRLALSCHHYTISFLQLLLLQPLVLLLLLLLLSLPL